MSSRADILEALHHLTDTRARLAKQPGTHRARHDLIVVADRLLDELSLIEEGERCLKSSPSFV